MILVTGMHRSGTSLVAMTLDALGISFGSPTAFYGADRWNQHGYFERRDVMNINNRMITGFDRTTSRLGALAGQVRYITQPALEGVAARGRGFTEHMRAIEMEVGEGAIKDPRLCLTWSSWAEVVDVEATVVCIRHPVDVADSLRRRQRIPVRLGLRFWRYHMRALRQLTPPRMTVVDLESLTKRPREELDLLTAHLDLGIEAGEAEQRFRSVYEPALVTDLGATRPELRGEIAELWDWLASYRRAAYPG